MEGYNIDAHRIFKKEPRDVSKHVYWQHSDHLNAATFDKIMRKNKSAEIVFCSRFKTVVDRDRNAAKNILELAKSLPMNPVRLSAYSVLKLIKTIVGSFLKLYWVIKILFKHSIIQDLVFT